MVAFFCSANLQASQIPSSPKAIVALCELGLCWCSTQELGLWLEITQVLQKTTWGGSPNLASKWVSCDPVGIA